MNKWYFGLPLVLVLAFAMYFVFVWDRQYEAGKEKIAAEQRAQREATLKAEMEARKKAVEEAKMLSEQRKAKHKADQDREAKEIADRREALGKRDKANKDVESLRRDITRLNDLIEVENRIIKDTDQETKEYLSEKEFLQKYVSLAQANAKRMLQMVGKIDEAEKKRAEAEAAKKNSRDS